MQARDVKSKVQDTAHDLNARAKSAAHDVKSSAQSNMDKQMKGEKDMFSNTINRMNNAMDKGPPKKARPVNALAAASQHPQNAAARRPPAARQEGHAAAGCVPHRPGPPPGLLRALGRSGTTRHHTAMHR